MPRYLCCQVRTALHVWASRHHLTGEQLVAVLGVLHYEPDR